MKKLTMMAIAAIVAFGLAGCTEKENIPPDDTRETVSATLSLSFRMPGAATRAVNGGDIEAVEEESTVNSITVFIFDSNGLPAAEGAIKKLDAEDDFEDPVDGLYEMKPGLGLITTTAGVKRIYVGVNLPLSLNGPYASESDLLDATAAVTALSDDAAGFVMFSEAVLEKNLVASPATNTALIDVSRVVSKVVASRSDDPEDFKVIWPGELTMTYSVQHFYVMNDATASYAVPNFYMTGRPKCYTDFAASSVINTAAGSTAEHKELFEGVPDDADFADMGRDECFYIGENGREETGQSIKSNTTYAVVSTKVTITHSAKVAGEAIEYATFEGSADDDIYIVKTSRKEYVAASKADALEIMEFLGELTEPVSSELYIYPGSWVHFHVWLNRYAKNDYAIKRNQFVHLKVDGVNGQANPGDFPGIPGTVEDSSKPIDILNPEDPDDEDEALPFDEDDDRATDLDDKDDPIEGDPAGLLVNVQILPWSYFENNAKLN